MRVLGWDPRGGAAALVLATLMAAAGARAGEIEDPDLSAARGHFTKGAEAYGRDDFQTALSEFEAGRVIKPAPAFDWNIGRCLDRLGRYPEAITAYRRYLATSPPVAEAKEVGERVKVLEERVAALEKVRAAAEAPVPAPMAAKSWAEPPGMPQGGAEKASVATIVAPPAENPAPTPVYRKWWLWTAVAALVVVAGGFAIAVASWPRDAQVPQSGLGATEVGFH